MPSGLRKTLNAIGCCLYLPRVDYSVLQVTERGLPFTDVVDSTLLVQHRRGPDSALGHELAKLRAVRSHELAFVGQPLDSV